MILINIRFNYNSAPVYRGKDIPMDVKKFQYFITIAEEKSISQAAKRLYISQPALTQFLHNLESEIGVKLFERIGNHYLPTAAGKIYLKGAYSIVATKRETYNLINESKNGNVGDFNIALTHSQNVHRIHYLFLKMKERFPNVSFHALECSSEMCPDSITTGMADIGIISQPHSSRHLSSIPLWDDYPMLVTQQDHSLDDVAKFRTDSRFPVVSLKDVENRVFISMTHSSHVRQECDELFQKAMIKPNIVFECPFVSSLMQILERTDYVAIAPMGLLNFNPNFRYYRVEDAPSWNVMAIHRNNMPLLEHHEYFIEIMRNAPLLDNIV